MHGTLHTTCVRSVHGDQKRALDLLESQIVPNLHMGAGTKTEVLW